MLYKFRSQATADLIMLQANGEQLLGIIGKTPGTQGILTVEQIPAAIAALEAAVAAQEAAVHPPAAERDEDEEGCPGRDGVMLRQRAAPFINMLQRSLAADEAVVWGL